MAVQTPATVGEQHIIGDIVFRNYNFTTTINNGDTWTPAELRIEALIIQPTTAAYVGFTISNGVVTFAASAGFIGRIGVIARLR
jgi:hypothetical protein